MSAFALEHFNLTLVDDERLLVVRKVLEGFDLCNLSQTHEQLSKESPLLQYWVAESPKKAELLGKRTRLASPKRSQNRPCSFCGEDLPITTADWSAQPCNVHSSHFQDFVSNELSHLQSKITFRAFMSEKFPLDLSLHCISSKLSQELVKRSFP